MFICVRQHTFYLFYLLFTNLPFIWVAFHLLHWLFHFPFILVAFIYSSCCFPICLSTFIFSTMHFVLSDFYSVDSSIQLCINLSIYFILYVILDFNCLPFYLCPLMALIHTYRYLISFCSTYRSCTVVKVCFSQCPEYVYMEDTCSCMLTKSSSPSLLLSALCLAFIKMARWINMQPKIKARIPTEPVTICRRNDVLSTPCSRQRSNATDRIYFSLVVMAMETQVVMAERKDSILHKQS